MGGFKAVEKIDVLGAIGKEKQVEQKPTVNKQKELLELKSRLKWSNIPKRYLNAKFKPSTQLQEKLAKKIIENIEYAGNKLNKLSDMLLYGNAGTGKTYMACAFLIHLIGQGKYVKYITEYDLLELYFRKEYNKFDGFKRAELLVLDEIGKRELQDWQKIQLEELISYRYNEMLPTFYITNLDKEELKHFIGDRATDRMKENNIVAVKMVGESLRGN